MTSASIVVSKPERPPPHGHLSNRRVSGWWLVATLVITATAVLAVAPLSETDVFWHIKVGEQMVRHHGFPATDPWNFTFPHRSWTPTAWLSEVVLYGIYHVGGAVAINTLRITLVIAICCLLARQLFHRRTPWIAVAVFTATILPLQTYDQERPQLVSFLLLIWLAGLCRQIVSEHRRPNLWLVGGLTWLWANFHGYWALTPAALLVCAGALALDGGRAGWFETRRCVVAAAVAFLGAGLTPIGPSLLLTPLTVSRAAQGVINEWQPTSPTAHVAFGLDLVLLALVAAWARSTSRTPKSELLWVTVWTVFAFMALRNVVPAMLLLAPWAADRLETNYGDRHTGPLIPAWLLPVVAIPSILSVALLQFAAPAIDPSKPARIAERLSAQTRELRVLNDYDVSGYLILRGGDSIRLAIDGRADRYGNAFIKRYIAAERGMAWKPLVSQLHPDVAVLAKNSQLAADLVEVRHWHTLQHDGMWLLLARPGFHLTPTSRSDTTRG